MRSNGLFLFVMCLLLFTALAPAEAEPQASSEASDVFFLCKNMKGRVRWLRAYKSDSGKCQTVYSKEGYLQIISSATYMTSCVGVLHNVRKNIEEGGYKCAKQESYSYIEVE